MQSSFGSRGERRRSLVLRRIDEDSEFGFRGEVEFDPTFEGKSVNGQAFMPDAETQAKEMAVVSAGGGALLVAQSGSRGGALAGKLFAHPGQGQPEHKDFSQGDLNILINAVAGTFSGGSDDIFVSDITQTPIPNRAVAYGYFQAQGTGHSRVG